jgi:uncharacterized membrane protein YgdD (TMEM256/DUF423 family)
MQRHTFVFVFVAALEGAAGVVLSAAAAHVEASPLLSTASQFLMIHAAAGLALAVTADLARSRWLAAALVAMLAGAALFAGDLAVRAFTGSRLFPYAAPTGGSLVIAGWVLACLGALAAAIRRNP